MLIQTLIFILVIEIATILGRLIFGPMRTFHKKNHLPVRIHHGYIGLVLALIGYIFYPNDLILSIGLALFISDAFHHFILLPLWVGRTEFP